MTENEKTTMPSQEQVPDIEQFGEIAHERHEAMRDQLERAQRQHDSRKDENDALAEATNLAGESDRAREQTVTTSPAERRRGAPSKKQRATSLKAQLKQAQSEMNTTDRAVSKVIHARPIEATSELLGSTIARPNALLSGSIAAFIGVTLCYFTAKYYGFQLSGFETIAAFIFGWIIGILYDYFSVMIRGHKKD